MFTSAKFHCLRRVVGLIAVALVLVLSAGASHGADNSEHARREAKYWIEHRLLEHDITIKTFQTEISIQADSVPRAWLALAELSVILPDGREKEYSAVIKLAETCQAVPDSRCWSAESLWVEGARLKSTEIDGPPFQAQGEDGTMLSSPSDSAAAGQPGKRIAPLTAERARQVLKHGRKALEQSLLELGVTDLVFMKPLSATTFGGLWNVKSDVSLTWPDGRHGKYEAVMPLMQTCEHLSEFRCWFFHWVELDGVRHEYQPDAFSKTLKWFKKNMLGKPQQ